jgi:hypothetical protein
MNGRVSLAAIAAACAALAVVPGVAAAGTLDQQQANDSSGFGVSSGVSVAQTFTAGITGDMDGIDLALEKNASPTVPLSVEIREAFPGFMGATVLAAASIPASAFPGDTPPWFSIPLAAPVPVTAGSHYAIILHANTVFPNTYSWDDANADVYAGGTALLALSSPPTTPWTPAADDQAFKTYVVPAPGSTPPPTPPAASGPTGLQAAALKKCKKKKSKKARKKCKKKAAKLPV